MKTNFVNFFQLTIFCLFLYVATFFFFSCAKPVNHSPGGRNYDRNIASDSQLLNTAAFGCSLTAIKV